MLKYHQLTLTIVVIALSTGVFCNAEGNRRFPPGFLVGTGTSAYQIEGAWNISDKGENVWDRYIHSQPGRIKNRVNGDIACDSYHKFKEDVQLLKRLGVDYYRFSLSWSRILPTGYANVISQDGVKYYNDLLDELEKNNIAPFVTIYHWDHPQVFQDIGGWTNEAMVDLFGDYARVVFKLFGHRVKKFITINEPNVVCEAGYFTGIHAPGLKIGKQAEYLCSTNIIKAHARAYHIYHDEFKKQHRGKIGIVLNCSFYYAKYKNDTISPEVAFNYGCGRYLGPIFSKNGDYPEIIKERIAKNSEYEGLRRSRLPKFSEEWINYIKGSADYLGLNHYSSKIVEPAAKPNETIYLDDDGIIYSYDPKWPSTPTTALKIVPEGFRNVLMKLKEEYGDPDIYVTENGLADSGTLEDNQRMEYIFSYLNALLEAIDKGVKVKSYTIWSLMDNFEWEHGYSEKYGLFQVDFNHPNRTRIPKKSVSWLSAVFRERKLLPIPVD